MRKLGFILILILLASGKMLLAQENPVTKADREFGLKNYSSAIQHYQKAIDSGKDNIDVPSLIKKIGIAYQEMNNYKLAIQNFEKYLAQKKDDNEVRYRYGDLLLRSGDSKKAMSVFEDLLKSSPGNAEYIRMIASCNKSIVESQKKEMPPIKNQNLINSKQSEFGLAFFDNKLVFASSRISSDYSSIHERTNQGFSDFYGAKYDSVFQMYNKPEKLNWILNTQFNEGTFTYNPNSKIAYYTQCKKSPDLCRILKAKWNNGKWSDIKQILSSQPEYDLAHPALSADMQTLYFSSNLPGGLGGKDIWRAPVLFDGEIGTPERLDNTINTPLNEMFPYMVGDTILLFASEGHVGMGGLDLYYSKITNSLFERPINLGAPINSNSDDFGILVNPDLRGGYFCSNRNNEEQSDDIFAFFHNIFLEDLNGKVIDSITFKPIPDAKITYYVEDSPVKIIYSDANGKFTIPNSAHSLCEESHHILVEKDKYFPRKMDVPCYSEKEIVVFMDDGSGRNHTLEGIVLDKKTNKPVLGVKVTLKSLKGLDLEAITGTDGKYKFEGVTPDDYITLRASKDGYLTDSKSFMTPAGPETINISPVTGFDTGFGLYPIEKNVEFRIENIYYEFDKATLLPESKTSLNKLVNILMENPQVLIKINSHTDNRGSDKYNLGLSGRRGASVVEYLTKAGITGSRLNSQGYGESKPEIANAKTEEEHQLNRRTTFEIVGEDNKILARSDKPDEKSASISLSSSQLLRIIEDARNEGKVIDEAFLMDLKLKMGISGGLSENTLKSGTKSEPAEDITTDKKEIKAERAVEVVKNNQPKPFITETNKTIEKSPANVGNEIFRVQIAVTSTGINLKEKFKNIYDLIQKYGVTVEPVNNQKKYQIGNFSTRQEAVDLKSLFQERGLNDTFIVTIKK